MTNADKIRAMTNAELAEWLCGVLSEGREWFDARSCRTCQTEHGGKCPTGESNTCLISDAVSVRDWLAAPAEV